MNRVVDTPGAWPDIFVTVVFPGEPERLAWMYDVPRPGALVRGADGSRGVVTEVHDNGYGAYTVVCARREFWSRGANQPDMVDRVRASWRARRRRSYIP
jgi:hypothetical protein